MNKMQAQVAEFHETFGLGVGYTPAVRNAELRLDLIKEEWFELIDGLHNKNLIESADALGDLLYVIFGTAVEFGLDMEPIFDEIHRSNMAKEGGHRREDGKWMKPADWTPPDLAAVIRDQEIKTLAKELVPSGDPYQ
mgnify:CR=1 FL=1